MGRQAGRALGRTHAAVKYKSDHLGLEYCAEIGWPTADKQRLRELIESGLSHREAAEFLGRPYHSVKMMAYNLQVRTRTRYWSDQQLADLRRLYGTMEARELAAQIGKPLVAVYRMAYVLRLVKPRPAPFSAEDLACIRELNAEGYSDTHIATELGRDRHETGKHRRRLGLPSHARGERWRQNIATGVQRACERAGLPNLAALRGASYRAFARRYNLPGELSPRCVQIVLALLEHGAMTLVQIRESAGIRGPSGMIDNRRGTSYLATLRHYGLIAYISRREGKRRLPGLYMLTAAALERLAAAGKEQSNQ